MPLVRAHATKCLEAWTDEREHRFVEGRAKLLEGDEFPVVEAIDKVLEGQRVGRRLRVQVVNKAYQPPDEELEIARAVHAGRFDLGWITTRRCSLSGGKGI